MATISGQEDRQIDRAYEKAMRERKLGVRPPIGVRPVPHDLPDPVLDRVLRMIRKRRSARMRSVAP